MILLFAALPVLPLTWKVSLSVPSSAAGLTLTFSVSVFLARPVRPSFLHFGAFRSSLAAFGSFTQSFAFFGFRSPWLTALTLNLTRSPASAFAFFLVVSFSFAALTVIAALVWVAEPTWLV